MEFYTIKDLGKSKIRINLKRIIDENNILKNQIVQNCINQVHFTLDIYGNGTYLAQRQYSRIFVLRGLFDQPVIFNVSYEDLPLDTRIAISIWSSAKSYDKKRPLGSTIVPVFNQDGLLNQGKYHLFIWPDLLPDIQQPSSTPGFTNDQNVQTINFITSKLQQFENSSFSNKKIEQSLKLKLIHAYRLIPAAFLQVQFPKFNCQVFYTDKISKEFVEPSSIIGDISQMNHSMFIYDPDFQQKRSNPLEQTFYFLKRQSEKNPQKLEPSRQQMKQIQTIVARSFKVQLKPSQKELFVTYRYYLSHDRKYLIYYLYSAQWNGSDDNQIQKLVDRWERIQLADALHLLSKDFSINLTYNKRKNVSSNTMKIIRNYAVSILRDFQNEDLISILLHLTQTLRYDQSNNSPLFAFLVQRALQNQQMAILMYWYLRCQNELKNNPKQKQSKTQKQSNYQNVQIYVFYFQKFRELVCQKKQQLNQIIQKQIKFIQYFRKLSKQIKEMKDINLKKQELRKKLAQLTQEDFGTIIFPMDPSKKLKLPIPAQCTIFNSAMAPFKLTFDTQNGQKFSFIYKNGDDLRQDQLILQMFSLMDKLLKGVNQDYRLTPYKALACSKSDGYVEFVPQTETFQNIKIKEYLQKLIQTKTDLVMQNYVFSCAGYCAITFFFGIGDRHLQNLLIATNGKMFHIDFGFILGRDPKPYPPPIKIRKQMVDAMGGTQSDNFKVFKSKCLEAYLYLRKYAKLIYNLFYLMLDSGIKDVHMQGLGKLYDKFSISMKDKQAEKHFLMVLQQCKNAIFGRINDGIHRWADYFK